MQETPHGFTAKVADFGLSREMQSTVIETRTCGTITHMPPELLSDDVVSKVPLQFLSILRDLTLMCMSIFCCCIGFPIALACATCLLSTCWVL